MSPQIAVSLARLRMPAILALIILLVADWIWHILPGGWPGWTTWAGIMAAFVVLMRAGTLRREPVVIRPRSPVGGWIIPACCSPPASPSASSPPTAARPRFPATASTCSPARRPAPNQTSCRRR